MLKSFTRGWAGYQRLLIEKTKSQNGAAALRYRYVTNVYAADITKSFKRPPGN
jgi:hypothetical protein